MSDVEIPNAEKTEAVFPNGIVMASVPSSSP
jgi:hypothetical protein